jgi:cation transport ATPase
MADLVDIALPAVAQAAAETLGLTVQRSVTSGARIRDIPRDEAELAIEYLREWGFAARILERTSGDEPGTARVA